MTTTKTKVFATNGVVAQILASDLPRRPVGRPAGSVDRHGKCCRVVSEVEAERWVRATVGAAIGRAMQQADVSASELAAAIGVDACTILRWVRGAGGAATRRLYQISQALGVPIDHLLSPPR